MRRFHLIFGAVVIVVFVMTGQYMDKALDHLAGMREGVRMLYRTRHIYILFTGLVSPGIGAYVRPHAHQVRRYGQWCGSLLITVAACLFIES